MKAKEREFFFFSEMCFVLFKLLLTKFHRLGSLNYKNVFLPVLKAGMAEIRVPDWCASVKSDFFVTPWTVTCQAHLSPWDSPSKNTGVGCHFLLQGIFLTQGSNLHLLCLLHLQAASLPLVPPGKPGEGPLFPGLHTAFYCALTWQREKTLACSSSHKGTSSTMKPPLSWPHPSPIISPNLYLQIPSH